MNATILCPGPSLADYTPSESSGIVVGVNRAAELHQCDVWSAIDHTLVRRVHPIGMPTLLTTMATRESLERRGKAWPYLAVTHCGVANGGRPGEWSRYSATSALHYLVWMGATRVETWGVNWQGTADWDGEMAGENRTLDRWRDERSIWDRLVRDNHLNIVRH